MLLQFKEPVTKDYREKISEKGVEFISYIPENAWIVKNTGNKGEIILEKKVHYLAPYKPSFRIDPQLKKQAKEKTGEVQTRIQFFKSTKNPEEILSRHGKLKGKFGPQTWKLETSWQNISEIAKEKHVKWMAPKAPNPTTFNDKSRELIEVNQLQKNPYNLNGTNFTAAVWDAGWAGDHNDLIYSLGWSDKTIRGDSGYSVDSHATHVAGTMAGGGKKDSAYRGMSPKSRIITYEWPDDSNEIYSETEDSTSQYNSLLSQNSWGSYVHDDCTQMGNYEGASSAYDDISSGNANQEITSFIFAAGNERSTQTDSNGLEYCGAKGYTYNTTTGPGGTAKNTITVGAVDDTGDMTGYSSWGPTDDGRIKPTVVSDGGCGDNSAIYSTTPSNNYGSKCGTSMAAPAVSGATILLNQQFNRTYGELPAPATVKGTFIHTAEDLGNEGPDFKFGWGLVNATAAIDYINESDEKNLIKRGNISGDVSSDSDSYSVTVPKDESLKFTLVWSDYPSDSSNSKHLMNDLDLVVKNGNDERQYPWTINWSDRTEPAEKNMEDHINPVEQVKVDNTNTTKYSITVEGNVQSPSSDPSQDYTLLMTSKETDLVAPNVSTESPENTTYESVPDFNLSSNESLVDARFSIDGSKNYSMEKKNSTYFYNTSAVVEDGFHEAVYWGNDSAGNYGSDSVFFTLDTLKPSVTPLAPVEDANLSSDFDVNASWSDSGTGVEKHNFTISNSIYSEEGLMNGSVNLEGIADGSYTIFYNVTDGAGNEKVKSRNVNIDTGAPEISVNSPSNNTLLTGSFETAAVFNDSVTGTEKINISLENSSGIQKSDASNLSINTASYADRYYNITFWANDSAGNIAEKFLNVSFDNSPPEIMIISPSENNSEVSTPFDVNASWSDFSETDPGEFEVSNSSGIQVTGELNATLTSGDLGRGRYNISYEVSDKAGNKVNKTYNISVNIPPGIDVHSPESRVYGETPVFNMSSSDSLDDAFVEVNGSNRTLESSGDYFVNESIDLPNGSFEAVLYGNDTEGVLGKQSVEFTVDQEKPEIEVTSPVKDANLSGDFRVKASVNDSFSSVDTSSFQVFNSSGNQTREKDLNGTIDVSRLADGSYNITLRANDSVGNLEKINRSFTLDTSKPSLQIFRPDRSPVSGEFNVNFTSNDSVAGLKNSSFVLKNSSGDPVLRNDSNISIDSSDYPDGDYTLEFNASDRAGNSRSSEAAVEFDNTRPEIEILSPSGENLSGEVDVKAAVNDSNFDQAIYRWKNGSNGNTGWKDINGSGFDTANLEEGTRELSVRANDTVGNENTVSEEFTVDNTAPDLELNTKGYEELENGWVRSGFTLQAECSDATTGVRKIEYSGGEYSFENSSSSLSAEVNGSGDKFPEFTCYDFTSSNSVDKTREYSLDSGPPEVESAMPLNGSDSVDRSFDLSATLHDEESESGVAVNASNLSIDSGSINDINWSNDSFTADVSDLDYSSTFTITGEIKDYAGQVHSLNLEYTTKADPDSGGDGGDGGGGGGGGGFSTTPASEENEEMEETSVEKGEGYVRVNSLHLDDDSGDISLSDAGTVFQSLEISGTGTVDFEINRDVEEQDVPSGTKAISSVRMDLEGGNKLSTNATFVLPSSWLQEENLRPEKVALYREENRSSEWQKLETTMVDASRNGFLYRANIPDFSIFTVAGERESCVKQNFSVAEDGECRQVTQCEEPEGEVVDSCASYDSTESNNSTENRTSLMAKMQVSEPDIPEIKLKMEDLTPFLILLAVLTFVSIGGYLTYQWYEKYQLQETLEDIKEISGKDPELIYSIDTIELAIQEGDYEKAAEKMKDIKEMIDPEEKD